MVTAFKEQDVFGQIQSSTQSRDTQRQNKALSRGTLSGSFRDICMSRWTGVPLGEFSSTLALKRECEKAGGLSSMSWIWILSVPGNHRTCLCSADKEFTNKGRKQYKTTVPLLFTLHGTAFSSSPHRIYWLTRSLISSSRLNYLRYVLTDAVICVHINFERILFTGSWSIKAEEEKNRSSTEKLSVDLLFFSLLCLMSGATIHQFQPRNKQLCIYWCTNKLCIYSCTKWFIKFFFRYVIKFFFRYVSTP